MRYSLSAEMVAIVVWFAALEGLVWSVPLHQYKSAINCPQPTLLRHSSTEPQLPPGSTFVGHCTFTFSPSDGRPSITWQQPVGNNTQLNSNTTVSIEWGNSTLSGGSLQSVTTSISIANISSADQGVYIARVSNHCGAKAECHILLSTLNRCYHVVPTVESTKHHRMLVVPESQQVSIQAEYSGDTDCNHFDVQWQLNSSSDLIGTDKVGKFRSYRKVRGLCSFTEILTINNASYLDSGLYTAYVSQHTSHANMTTDLQIIPWPTVTVWPGKSVQLCKSDTPLSYHLANFTKYISLVIVKDDAVINRTGYGMVIRHNPLEGKNITVNVMIPEGANGQYKLCYEFTGNVSTAHNQPRKWCTENTNITTELPRSKESFRSLATALGVAIGLSVVVFAACMVFICKLKSKRKKRSRKESEENTSLVQKKSLQRDYGSSGQDTNPPPENGPDSYDVSTDNPCKRPTHNESAGSSTGTSLWRQVPADIIEVPRVIGIIAREVKRWEPLARRLGLQDSEIVAIQENNKGDYEEQKYQMIRKWRERSGSQATLRRLVQCVEEEHGDRELAQRIHRVAT